MLRLSELKNSFSFKVLLLPILSICLTVLSVMTITMFLYDNLSMNVYKVIGNHMQTLYIDFIKESSKEIAADVRQQVEQITNELKILAGATQNIIDIEAESKELGKELQRYPYFKNEFEYNENQNWSNIIKGKSDLSLSVWGYQHDSKGRIDEATLAYANALSTLKPLLNSIGSHGVKKGWVYVVGPKRAPLVLMHPWEQMPAIFDEKYPGHNQSNFWDFFFPNIIEGWEQWIQKDSAILKNNTSLTTITPFYDDAGGTGTMLTFFYPLWSAKRDSNYGAAAIDINVDKIAGIVKDAKIGDSGFSFIMTNEGEILGLNENRKDILGVQDEEDKGTGVTKFSTNIFSSSISSLAKLELPAENDDYKLYEFIGKYDGYYLALHKMGKIFKWNGNGIAPVTFYIAVMVPKSEVFSVQSAILKEISGASAFSVSLTILAALAISVLAIALAVLIVLKGTKQIRLLTQRAQALAKGDFETEVDVVSSDELGGLARTFNSMSSDLFNSRKQLQDYADNLESLVAERTKELEKANLQLENLSRIDGLTGISNRRHFDESISQMWRIANRDNKQLSLIMFDVDHFKKYNDLYGHQKGDLCLKLIASVASHCARRALDLVFRYGGEEFAVIIIGSSGDAAIIAERLRQSVENERITHEQGCGPYVTISLGVCTVLDFAAETPAMLIARTDAALYQSKREGRNRITVA